MVNEIACLLFGMNCAAVVPECAGLRVEDPWVREAPPGAEVQAAYMTLVNDGGRELILTGVAAPAFARAEFHRMWFEGDRMRMEPLPTLAVPAHGRVALEPGGDHVMLYKPDQRLRPGDTVHLRLQCGEGKTFVEAPVRRAGVAESESHHSH
ncbi:MAG TPA: copper chaperone PCu(A)C [Nevskiales bacterium]|nr:copper chaperone PCu(A)C [Nevskiales bacterium]